MISAGRGLKGSIQPPCSRPRLSPLLLYDKGPRSMLHYGLYSAFHRLTPRVCPFEATSVK
jgi:hypothetical protein